MPLYASSVLTILDTILRSNEISMAEETITTFDMLCCHQDVAVLAADRTYIRQYLEIVKRYASFLSLDQTPLSKTPLTTPLSLRWRKIGIRAIESVTGSEALATDGVHQLDEIIPVILSNLYSDGDASISALEQRAEAMDELKKKAAANRRSTNSRNSVQLGEGFPAADTASEDDKSVEMEVRVLALRCLQRIFSSSNATLTRISTPLLLRYIVNKRPSWGPEPENWAKDLIDTLTAWTPVQNRYLIAVAAMESLVNTPLAKSKLEEHLVLTAVIHWLLSSPNSLIGLSVIDVLVGLLQHLLLLLRLSGGRTHNILHKKTSSLFVRPVPNGVDSQKQSLPAINSAATSDVQDHYPVFLQLELSKYLQTCIGDLATHIYYSDQISDSVKTLLSRLRPSETFDAPSSEESEGPGLREKKAESFFSFPDAQGAALNAVKNVLIIANSQGQNASVLVSRNKVGINVWEDTQWLLHEHNPSVRHTYVDAFLTWLHLEGDKVELSIPLEMRQSRLGQLQGGFLESSDRLARSIGESIIQQTNTATITLVSNFLQILHLSVFDSVTEFVILRSDILVFHALLTTLVDAMGVNAIEYGLPVIMALQEGQDPSSTFNISSLVYGYLWAIVAKFNLESTNVGSRIMGEIARRKQNRMWIEELTIPALPIARAIEVPGSTITELSKACVSFTEVNELVSEIAAVYRNTTGCELPSRVKDQMTTPWSRAACVASIEADDNRMSSSISGAGASSQTRAKILTDTQGERGPSPANTDPSLLHEKYSTKASPAGADVANITSGRQRSLSGQTHSQRNTLKVKDLRRVLSVIHNQTKGLDASSGSSKQPPSTESMSMCSLHSDENSAVSTAGPNDAPRIKRDSVPPSPSLEINGKAPAPGNNGPLSDEGVPPVPAIPAGFEFLGTSSDQNPTFRPSTAPAQVLNVNSDKVNNGNRASGFNFTEDKPAADEMSGSQPNRSTSKRHSRPGSLGRRAEVAKLLDGLLSPQELRSPELDESSFLSQKSGNAPSSENPEQSSSATRRSFLTGTPTGSVKDRIVRPPY